MPADPTVQRRREREHDRALEQHDRAWEAMHALGLQTVREGADYLTAREDVVVTAAIVRHAAREARQRVWNT